ncbi:amino acid adenylation domain-containing protein [Aureivirga marina]|uniref:amino acid adenylation domain-containing protein n=1 Tax=Aureivirga marina TaxID=1182451 RepID=UPI0018CAAD97|nr:amino acid adenylation domain-containing protein [Aureivirga marina]
MKINITEYLKETATKYSSKIAIEDKNGQITFSELEVNAYNLANHILRIEPELNNSPIPVFLPKEKETIISFIGVVLSGNFYVPLDVKSPIQRLDKIFEKLDSKILITSKKFESILSKTSFEGRFIYIEDLSENPCNENEKSIIENKLQSKIDLDPVYSIFTSGSTGTPKGVLISHRGVIDYIEWAKEVYSVDENEIIGSQAPFYFDNSTLDIYLMLATGAKLIIVPEEKYMFPVKLLEYINQKQITFVFWVPSVLVNAANLKALENNSVDSLHKILFAGEVMPNKHLNYWRKEKPDALYSNLYGPTEITVDCTYYIVDREFKDEEPLPIGKACRNTDLLILNEKDELCASEEIGELCVKGSSLAFGYYKDFEKTESVFVQNPVNNDYREIIYRTGDLVFVNERDEIIFVGRKDSQIKHMGYRIELGEIENIILGIEEIENICVIYDSERKIIKAYYIGEIEFIEIRKKLVSLLPKYMIPTKWFKTESFPYNSNGKIDRKKIVEVI